MHWDFSLYIFSTTYKAMEDPWKDPEIMKGCYFLCWLQKSSQCVPPKHTEESYFSMNWELNWALKEKEGNKWNNICIWKWYGNEQT